MFENRVGGGAILNAGNSKTAWKTVEQLLVDEKKKNTITELERQ